MSDWARQVVGRRPLQQLFESLPVSALGLAHQLPVLGI